MVDRAGARSLATRTVRIGAFGGAAAARMAAIAASSPKSTRGTRLAAELARLMERLGGAFVKAGQILGTRVDLVGETVATALGRLHDSVEPMAPEEALRTIRAGLGLIPPEFVRAVGGPSVAGGSIACVYRAERGGRAVAVKVRRPGVGAAIAADMAVLRAAAVVAARLPALRRVPFMEIVDQVGDCLMAQLDFGAEAANLRRLHDDLAEMPGVVVPRPVPELSGDGVIAMEFIEGLDRGAIEALPARVREGQITSLVHAVYRMLFVEGFIHIDLHQGNTYFMPDGTVVLLDAGLVFRMSPEARERFTGFFAGMIRGDGEVCADILLSTVRRTDPETDIAAFRAEVSDLVVRNVGVVARDFDLPAFCLDLFDLQRKHRLYAEPEFIFPMLCLLTLQGLVKRYHPMMDFQLEAAPFVMHGLLVMSGATG
ncbi:ABC1 kinase family protein [Actinomadura mexicana]|uniref:Ubiquinone biosynthesis protein n=1 Tax=Actinomadura mexicana TaxID=134959 RepID=A0A239EZL2_9ACTN|nr:AarF/UbiB family protein [Actinomadura mexicana]SNS50027.1 ubiquinone biosynthesis protein [Actinomadura mexicana]